MSILPRLRTSEATGRGFIGHPGYEGLGDGMRDGDWARDRRILGIIHSVDLKDTPLLPLQPHEAQRGEKGAESLVDEVGVDRHVGQVGAAVAVEGLGVGAHDGSRPQVDSRLFHHLLSHVVVRLPRDQVSPWVAWRWPK
jgi:hypothetical protein